MDQNEIRDYNGQQYTVSEGAALIKELNARTISEQEGYNSIDELATKLKALKPTNTPNIGTDVDLSNPATIFKTDVANNATAYAVAGTVVAGGNETRLINAATKPTVTGASPIAGSDFVANTNMYLVTWNNGTINEYHFQEI